MHTNEEDASGRASPCPNQGPEVSHGSYRKLEFLYHKLQHEMMSEESALEKARNAEDALEARMEIKSNPSDTTKDLMTAKIPPISLSSPASCFPRNENKEKQYSLSAIHQLSPHDEISRVYDGETTAFHQSPFLRVIPESARWKQLYLSLLDEFQRYKYATEALIITSDQAIAEKITESTHHLQIAKEEQEEKLQKYRIQLDQASRDRLILQTEIKAVRDQLTETSETLREKSIFCEALQRRLDEQSMGTTLERHEEDTALAECKTKLAAAESRVAFLQQEVAGLSNKNVQLQRKITQVLHESAQEVQRLRKAEHGITEYKEKEIVEIQQQQDETVHQLQTQQAYIHDLDNFIMERMEINEHVSKQVQHFAHQVAQETEKTLQILEERLRKTMEEKVKLEASLEKANKVILRKSDHGKRQAAVVMRFIAHIHQILSVPAGESPPIDQNTTMLATDLDNPFSSDDTLCSRPKELADQANDLDPVELIKGGLKKLVKNIVFCIQQHQLHRSRLLERIRELEQEKAEQKQMGVEEVDKLRKRCAFFKQVLRKIRMTNSGIQSHQLTSDPCKKSSHRDNENLPTIKEGDEELDATRSHLRLSRKDVGIETTFDKTQIQTQISSSNKSSKRYSSLVQRHEKFVRILNNTEKYLSEDTQKNS